jgi:hypothetical protein
MRDDRAAEDEVLTSLCSLPLADMSRLQRSICKVFSYIPPSQCTLILVNLNRDTPDTGGFAVRVALVHGYAKLLRIQQNWRNG